MRLPQVIFSPKGHYLLIAPPAGAKLDPIFSTVVHTRLHPPKEIKMIREVLIGPANTETLTESSRIKASNSFDP